MQSDPASEFFARDKNYFQSTYKKAMEIEKNLRK